VTRWIGLAAVAAIGTLVVAVGGGSSASSLPTARQVTTQPKQRAACLARREVAAVPRRLVGQIPDRMPMNRHLVALTFDAGANDAGAPKILPVLERTGATGTFFMTGRWAQLYPGWARLIASRYPIANHTFDHRDLLGIPLQNVSSEVLGAAASIKHATGCLPARLFRFPYGSSNGSTLAVVNSLGYTAVGWTVDTLGWEGTTIGQSVSSVFSRAIDHLQPGEIVLMHVGSAPDGSTLDADALPRIISAIRARGYNFVTLVGNL
jgi:peptidoglycan/xylan/chitin deacetylase (PgdA/CDA1 family)